MRFTCGGWLVLALGTILLFSVLALRVAAPDTSGASVQVLFDLGDGTYAWSSRVAIANPAATNATWNATLHAAAEAGVSMDWTWYACCGAFINALGGQSAPVGTGLFLWNATAHGWDAADLGLSSLVLHGNATIAISNSAYDSVTYAVRTPVPNPEDRYPVTQFRGDLANRGIGPTAGPRTDHVVWDRALPLQEIAATPAVGLGRVYVNTLDGFYALDERTGTVSWENLAVKGLSSPSLVDGTVLVGASDGKIHALGAADGHERWNTTLVEHPGFSGITSSPKVAYDLAYVGTFNESGGAGGVAALWISNGSVAWRHETASVDFSSPAVVGGSLYIGLMGRYNTTSQITWEPPYGVLALDAATGDTQWFFPTNASVAASPLVRGGSLFVPAKNGYLYALDRASGNLSWSRYVRAGVSSPALVGDSLVLGGGSFGEAGVLTAVDAASGAVRWSFATDGPVQASPTVAGGTVYVASNTASGTIYAVDATTGALVWSRTPSPQQFIFGSPVVADGRLYAVSDNGHVYAFADVPSTGTLAPSLFEPLTVGVIVAVVSVVAAVAILVRRSRRGR